MKKGLALIGITAALIAAYFVFIKKDENVVEVPKQQALAQGKHSEMFNKSMNNVLDGYFNLKNALVEWDTASASAAASALAAQAAQIPYDELQSDSTVTYTARSFSESVSAEALGITGETTIEGQRRSFYTLSENLYNLLRTVQYDQQVIYHDKCPMAFNDIEEAYWISNTKDIINPYLGKKHPKYHSGMLACGSVEDSIDYRVK